MVTEFNDSYLALINSKHIRAQAERVLPVVLLAHGTADSPNLDGIIHAIATCIMALQKFPDAKHAMDGPIRVIRAEIPAYAYGPPENYEVAVVGATVYSFQLWAENQIKENDTQEST